MTPRPPTTGGTSRPSRFGQHPNSGLVRRRIAGAPESPAGAGPSDRGPRPAPEPKVPLTAGSVDVTAVDVDARRVPLRARVARAAPRCPRFDFETHSAEPPRNRAPKRRLATKQAR